jgi:hypothetical protein
MTDSAMKDLPNKFKQAREKLELMLPKKPTLMSTATPRLNAARRNQRFLQSKNSSLCSKLSLQTFSNYCLPD